MVASTISYWGRAIAAWTRAEPILIGIIAAAPGSIAIVLCREHTIMLKRKERTGGSGAEPPMWKSQEFRSAILTKIRLGVLSQSELKVGHRLFPWKWINFIWLSISCNNYGHKCAWILGWTRMLFSYLCIFYIIFSIFFTSNINFIDNIDAC